MIQSCCMTNKENSPEDFSEEIQIAQGADGMVLTTKTTQKEVFLGVKEAVKSKKKELRSTRVASLGLIGLGVTAILVGGGIITSNYDFSNKANIARAISGFTMIVAGYFTIGFGRRKSDMANLASRQIEKIESTIRKG